MSRVRRQIPALITSKVIYLFPPLTTSGESIFPNIWRHQWTLTSELHQKRSTHRTATMDPSLALSLMAGNNTTHAHAQPSSRHPATNMPQTTTPLTTMDPDLARSLLQNNTANARPTHFRPNRPTNPNQTPPHRNPRSALRSPPALPSFPPPPRRSPASRSHQKLLKKLYPTPGVQPRDYTAVSLHPAGYAVFDHRKNPRGLPYPWREICRGDFWCVETNVIWRMPRGGLFGCGCGVM